MRAFDDFVVDCGPRLVSFAYLVCHDGRLAEDLAQDALIKAYRRWQMVEVERPEAYVRRIIVNEYASWRRRRQTTEITAVVPEPTVDDTAASFADRDLVWRLLRQLPRRQRVVLVLRYYEDYTDREIAQTLGCREGTVRSLAARAFSSLRQYPELRPAVVRRDPGGLT